jgi:hypothetical protein
MSRQSVLWLAAGAISVVAVGQAVFAAANTIPNNSAGYASKAVSGFTITAIDYNQNAVNPTLVDTVTFTATSPATDSATVTTYVRFVGGGAWYACTTVGGVPPAFNISCDTDAAPGPQLTAAAINTFDASIVEQ